MKARKIYDDMVDFFVAYVDYASNEIDTNGNSQKIQHGVDCLLYSMMKLCLSGSSKRHAQYVISEKLQASRFIEKPAINPFCCNPGAVSGLVRCIYRLQDPTYRDFGSSSSVVYARNEIIKKFHESIQCNIIRDLAHILTYHPDHYFVIHVSCIHFTSLASYAAI